MAKTKKSTKDLTALKERLNNGKLTKTDVTYLNDLVSHAMDFSKALETSKQKSGGKTIIAKLPFGLDIVK